MLLALMGRAPARSPSLRCRLWLSLVVICVEWGIESELYEFMRSYVESTLMM